MTANPIALAELRHQRYVINNSRSGRIWILLAMLMLLPALLASVVAFGAVMLGAELPPADSLDRIDSFATFIIGVGEVALITMNIAQYIVVMMISYGLAANSITREKRGNTWDNLLLTNVNARTIVQGKFHASLRALSGDYTMVAVLRVGLMASIVPISRSFIAATGGAEPLISRVDVLLLAVIVIAYTYLEAAMNTALSLFTVLLDVPGSVGASLFLLLRAIALGIGLGWLVTTLQIAFDVPGASFLLVGMIGLASYTLASWVMLRLAEVAAVRGSQATPVAI